jgi:hypothetical protein
MVQRTEDGRAQVGYSMVRPSGVWVTPYTICTRRWWVRVSWFGLKTKVDGFASLDLKTGNSGLKIWTSKSPRRFLGLSLKIKWTTICLLRQKIDRRRTAWDTRWDLAACFAWKVGLGFSSLSQNWWRSDDGWCTWHHHRGHIKMKSKTDESMRWAASDPSTLTLSFL